MDTSGDVFVSYNSTYNSGQSQAVAEVNSNGRLSNASVFSTSGTSALPGVLDSLGASASLPSISSSDILELQPDGQLFDFNPVGGSSQYDNFASYTPTDSKVYDVQTGAFVNLNSTINLANATFGDFGVYQNSIVVSAEANNWDFVMRLTYGSSPTVATILVASPASDGLTASPGGVAVDTAGTVLTTMPYLESGATTAIHVAIGFSLTYDGGGSPSPSILKLGLTSAPNIDSTGIAVDAENNFILSVSDSSLYGGGAGVVHIDPTLDAFLADPTQSTSPSPIGIGYQTVGGVDRLAIADSSNESYTLAGEIPLFSGQATPAMLREAYGINQIQFTNSKGQTVTGDGSGQTIAIVEEGVDPTLGQDLTTFDQHFGIPAPPNFTVIDQNGVTTQNLDIVGEASLDVEWAHAVAPGASIVVYNAAYDPNNAATSLQNLLLAMKQASLITGVSVVTLSYGIPESELAAAGISQSTVDSYFTTPGVTFLAASGDTGIYGSGSNQVVADYPASSSNILSVGGTSIVIPANGSYPGTGTSGETAWGDGSQSGYYGGGGGGLSSTEAEPAWQKGVVSTTVDPTGTRALPDVSIDSGATQEYDVFTSTLSGSSSSSSAVGWLGDAGTSAASPIWAGLIAIADQGRVLAGGSALTGNTETLPALYSLPSSDFHDILYGSNGDSAGQGYDLATGLGTPVANLLVPDLAGYEIPSKFSIKTEPQASVVAGSTFGMVVQVEDSLGNPVSGGTISVSIGNNPGGGSLGNVDTAQVVNGLATFTNLTISLPGDGYTLTVTDSTIAGSLTTSAIDVTANTSPNKTEATLALGNLNVTYSGAAQAASVTTSPTGLSGVTITYEQNGVPVTHPTAAGSYAVTATLDNPNYYASDATGTLVIAQATPTLTWAPPAPITAGTPLTAAQLDATATFDGTPLSGGFHYTPVAGDALGVGNSQVLSVTFTPTDSNDYKDVTSSVEINVLSASTSPAPTPTPTPVQSQAVIIGEQPIFERTLRKGKPTGPLALKGFGLEFNISLGSSALNPANYQLSTVTIKKSKKASARVLHPFTKFTVTYNPTRDSVILNLVGSETFLDGGLITVSPSVTEGTGSTLTGSTVFSISPGGKKIQAT